MGSNDEPILQWPLLSHNSKERGQQAAGAALQRCLLPGYQLMQLAMAGTVKNGRPSIRAVINIHSLHVGVYLMLGFDNSPSLKPVQ